MDRVNEYQRRGNPKIILTSNLPVCITNGVPAVVIIHCSRIVPAFEGGEVAGATVTLSESRSQKVNRTKAVRVGSENGKSVAEMFFGIGNGSDTLSTSASASMKIWGLIVGAEGDNIYKHSNK